MRLQRLEIAGFKSFPDWSELTFDTGVTAIVGPNGCGKSNVVDALTGRLVSRAPRACAATGWRTSFSAAAMRAGPPVPRKFASS